MPAQEKEQQSQYPGTCQTRCNTMSSTTTAITDGFKGRRSVYSLTNESTISDDRLEELITEVIKHTPSSFNSQTTRIVVLLKEENQKLWDNGLEVASSQISPELFDKMYKNRLTASRAAYGTVSYPHAMGLLEQPAYNTTGIVL